MKKRFVSMFFALALCLSMIATPVLAAESSADFQEVATAGSVDSINEVTELRVESGWVGADLPVRFDLTPSKGTNFKVVASCSAGDNAQIKVSRGTSLLKTITLVAGGGADTYDIANNCDGKSYTISIVSSGVSWVNAAFVQTEYV